jgi:hypothetical protein
MSTATSSFVERAIDVSITLGEGTLGQTASKAVKLSGLRVKADIHKRGSATMDQGSIRIYGMTPSLMNQLSTLGVPQTMTRPRNTVTVDAGDAVNGMATIFVSEIHQAFQSLKEAPESSFTLNCWAGQTAAMVPVAPTSTAFPWNDSYHAAVSIL